MYSGQQPEWTYEELRAAAKTFRIYAMKQIRCFFLWCDFFFPPDWIQKKRW